MRGPQYIAAEFGVKVFPTARVNPTLAILINRITNFSYYYSTSRLIICFFYLVIITNSESRTVTRAVKASLFPQLGRACRDCMALRISLVGQRCSRVEGECPGARIPSLFAVTQTVMGGLKLQDFILFSGDFTARPSELNRRRVPEQYPAESPLIWPVFGSCLSAKASV